MKKNLEPLIFCGSSHPLLGKLVADKLGIRLGRLSLTRFPDGETSVEVLEEVHRRDVFVLQTIALDPNEYLVEMLILIDALKRSSAKQIVAIIPYFGYCRQDRKDKPGVPITAKLVANLLTSAGATRLLTLDLHAGQLEGFFEIPVDHLRCQVILAKEANHLMAKDRVVVAPDVGSVKVAKRMAGFLKADLAVIEKQRLNPEKIKMTLIGDVSGKSVLIADDMCSTGGTLAAAADLCKEHGAKDVIAAVTHGLLVGRAMEKIDKSALNALLVTNTVPIDGRLVESGKLKVLSVSDLLAEAIQGLVSETP